jgi:hypothetical protein
MDSNNFGEIYSRGMIRRGSRLCEVGGSKSVGDTVLNTLEYSAVRSMIAMITITMIYYSKYRDDVGTSHLHQEYHVMRFQIAQIGSSMIDTTHTPFQLILPGLESDMTEF